MRAEYHGTRRSGVAEAVRCGLLTGAVWLTTMIGLAPDGRSLLATSVVTAVAWAVQFTLSTRLTGRSWVAGTRTFQASQLWFGAAAGMASAFLAARLDQIPVGLLEVLIGAGGSLVVFAIAQELAAARQPGSLGQRAVIVGTGEEAAEWVRLIEDHPEIGIELVGCIGDGESAGRVGIADRWLGKTADIIDILETEKVDLPIVAVTSFRRPGLQAVVDTLLGAQYDVAMSWGVGRLSSDRLVSTILSHETLPLIRAERPQIGARRVKRALDVVLATIMLIVAAPVLALAVLAVKVDSRGPALFRQQRVGYKGRTFEMIKLRTMVQSAESEVDSLRDGNQRIGPLFKMTEDPRVTRTGRLLRKTSIDEIPQLWNVLRGEMSLVGPRPALIDESEQFDEELSTRTQVRPGITGLWQVEARANKSFDAYRRLDLHYLENWSLQLDLRIMFATAQLLIIGTLVSPIAKRLWSRSIGPDIHVESVTSDQKTQPVVDLRDPARVAVLGAGYVGLTQAVCLAHLGHQVACADINPDRIAELRAGIPPILEDGLEQLLAEGNASGRLTFTEDPVEAVEGAEFVFLCVPTPQRTDGAADLSFLDLAAEQIADAVRPGAVVINKSTVPVGSTVRVAERLGRPDLSVVSNPEFLREGTAIADWLRPDRIVVGGKHAPASRVMSLYRELPGKRIVCDAASAELIKYASNAYLATRLTFVNSMSELCEKLEADVTQVTTAMGFDERIGSRYLTPGPGWGGSCLPKDTRALAYQAGEAGADFAQLEATIDANERHLDRAAETILAELTHRKEATVGVLGMAFKAGTGDTRESPAVKVAQRLIAAGVTVRAYDPGVMKPPVDGIEIAHSAAQCAAGADALVVLTEWPEFRDLDFAELGEAMTARVVIDLRNLLKPQEMFDNGFRYTRPGSLSITRLR